ncbi:MAG: hypothetical protein AAB019_01275 [Planctomycetota bacterium]
MEPKTNLSPEEQLLKLIEEPVGPRSESAEKSQSVSGDTVITRPAEKQGIKVRLASLIYALFSNVKVVFQGRSILKTLNRILMGVMLISLTYLTYDLAGAATAVSYEAILVRDEGVGKQLDVITPPGLDIFLAAANLRDVFAEIKPPEPTPTATNIQPLVNLVPVIQPPLPTSLDNLVKSFTITLITRPVEGQGTPLVVIDVKHPKQQNVYYLEPGGVIKIENENPVTVTKIEKEFIVVTDGTNEKQLEMLSK